MDGNVWQSFKISIFGPDWNAEVQSHRQHMHVFRIALPNQFRGSR